MTRFFRAWLKPLLAVLLFCAAGASAAGAADLAPPTGPVILVLRGAIAKTNAANEADFDLAMLEALPHTTVATTTAWTTGPQSFEGVSLAALLRAVGAQVADAGAKPLSARALNDYAVEIPAADLSDSEVIVAYKQNGQYMAVADKGPLWIIYPNSIASKDIQSRMIWQLNAIDVGP